jgi:hypothetical protein
MKATCSMACVMEKESFSIKKAATMMESGKTTKCMASALYTTLMAVSPTKASGKTTSSMARAKCTTTSKDPLRAASITQTSISWTTSGSSTRET